MGAPTAQVQSSQTSQPAGKNAGQSASSESQSMSLGGLSGQPAMGQPNTNGNTALSPINPTFVAPTDGVTSGQPNPYPNTISQWDNQSNQSPSGKGKGA